MSVWLFTGPTHGYWFGLAVTYWSRIDQRSYATPGPVSAWMGDRLWTGKPPRRRTRHPGVLSLSHPSESWESKHAHDIRGLAVQAGVWLKD